MDAENQPLTIAPSKKKVMTVTTIAMVAVLVGIGAFHAFMLAMGVNIPEQFMFTLETLGVDLDIEGMAKTGSMVGAIVIVGVYAVRNLQHSGNVVCYQDRLMESNSREVPYGNVTRVHYDKSSLPQNLLGYGTVFIEAGGMDKSAIKLEYVHDVENKVNQLQQIVHNFQMMQQQKAQQDARIRNIVEQW